MWFHSHLRVFLPCGACLQSNKGRQYQMELKQGKEKAFLQISWVQTFENLTSSKSKIVNYDWYLPNLPGIWSRGSLVRIMEVPSSEIKPLNSWLLQSYLTRWGGAEVDWTKIYQKLSKKGSGSILFPNSAGRRVPIPVKTRLKRKKAHVPITKNSMFAASLKGKPRKIHNFSGIAIR